MKTSNWKAAGCTLLLLLLAFVLGATPAGAQLSGKGTIQGVVTDKTGAVIPGATVTIVNNDTGFKAIRTTTGSGDYDISVDPGTYSITVAIKGFKSLTQQNVHVNALEQNEVDLHLQTGAVNETVIVTDAPPTLNTTDASLGATMEQEMYASLPVLQNADQRRASDFATLMPGVQANETNGNNTTNSGVVNGGGSRGAVSEIYINGIPFTNAAGEGDPRFVWTAISVDSINQFQLQTAGYPAIYQGQGVQNYVVKSGTNKYHGTIFDYFRNTSLDTWGFFGPNNVNPVSGAVTKPVEHQNEYGIFVGGPIWKNKIFFFGNYNGFRYSKPNYVTMTVPTLDMQQGNFTEWALANPGKYNIYDPATTVLSGSNYSRTAFSGNIIPSTRWDPIATKMNAFLAPYQSMITSATIGSPNLPYAQPTGLSNFSTTEHLDWQINPNHNISVIFAAGRQAAVGPSAASVSGLTGNGLPAPFTSSQVYAPKTKVIIFEDNYVINPKLVNQFKYGFGRYYSPGFNVDEGGAFAGSTLGLQGLPAGQASLSFPKVAFSSGGGQASTWAGYTGNVGATNSYTLIDNLQWNIRKHSVTIGGMIEWMEYNYASVTSGTSPLSLTFAQADTSNFTSGSTLSTTLGQSYASFLLGNFNSATETANAVAETGARFRPMSPYIQDDWKVSKKLTVNLGLRYDFFPSFREVDDRVSWLNPNLTNPLTGNAGALQFAGNGPYGCNCSSPVNNSLKQFGPRLGLAYQVTPKTVVRASYGVFYTHGNAVGGSSTSRQGSGQLGWSSSFSPADTATLPAGALGNNTSTVTGGAALVNTILPQTNFAPPAPSLTSGFGTGYYTSGSTTVSSAQKITYADPYYGGRSPQYINWSIGIQRELTPRTTLTISYVGSEGHFEISDSGNARGYWTNQLDPKYLQSIGGTNLELTATSANLATAGVTCPYVGVSCYSSHKVYQYLTPFPQYNGVSDPYGNVSNSNYHALQVTAIQRPGNGLTFMVNYTWSKAIDDGGTFRSGYAIPAALAQTPNSWKADRMDRSLSTSDQPQHLVVTGVWDMPFAKSRGNSAAHAIYHDVIGDWKFSEILQAYSGSPLPIIASNCGTNPAVSQCMPTLNPAWTSKSARMNGGWGHGATAKNYTTLSYINPTAFSTTPAYVFGNAARTAPYGLYGPGTYELDISLRRTFPIYKRASLLFEGDMFNVTNHTFFSVGSLTYSGSGAMGTITGQNTNEQSRDMQFAAKLQF